MKNSRLKNIGKSSVTVGLLALLFNAQTVMAAKSDIAIVHSYAPNISWVVNQSRGFQAKLGDQYKYTEYSMDTKRIDESKFKTVASNILDKIKALKPSIVYVTDDNALKLVGRYIDPDTPVIFSGINAHLREDYPWLRKTKNITGILERPLIKRNLVETMNAFGIQANKILVLMDTSLTSQYFFKVDLDSKEKFSVKRAEVSVFRSEKFSDWKAKILSAKEEGFDFLLIVGSFALKDDDKVEVDVVDVAKWISTNSPITPFTSHLQQIGKGLLVGGLQLNGEMMGADAGEIAKSVIVEKLQPHDIFPKTQTAGDLKYSKAEIKKWGLTVSPKYEKIVILLE